jgi:hypothetical protein
MLSSIGGGRPGQPPAEKSSVSHRPALLLALLTLVPISAGARIIVRLTVVAPHPWKSRGSPFPVSQSQHPLPPPVSHGVVHALDSVAQLYHCPHRRSALKTLVWWARSTYNDSTSEQLQCTLVLLRIYELQLGKTRGGYTCLGAGGGEGVFKAGQALVGAMRAYFQPISTPVLGVLLLLCADARR